MNNKNNKFYVNINNNNIFLYQDVIRKSDNMKGFVKNINLLSTRNCLILFNNNTKKIYSKKNIDELIFIMKSD